MSRHRRGLRAACIALAGLVSVRAASAQPQAEATPPAAARPPLAVEAIVDNVLNFEELHQKADEFLLNTTRTTLRASGALGEHLEYKAGVVWRLHNGTKTVDNVPFLSPYLRPTILPDDPVTGRPGTSIYLENQIASDFYLQEAYATLRLSRFYVRAGRQKIQNGTGYAYNPTDLFNRRIPLDPTYEADGADAVAVGWTIDPSTELQALAATRGDSVRVRFQTKRRGVDLAVQYTTIERTRVDWEAVNTTEALDALAAGGPFDDYVRLFRWHQPSLEIARTFGAARIYSEAGVAFLDGPADPGGLADSSGTHLRMLVGVDRTLAAGRRLVAEYMYVGEGRGAGSPMTLNDQMGLFKGEILASDHHNAFAEISSPFSQRTSGALKLVWQIDHPAFTFNPWVYFDPRPGLRLGASIYVVPGTAGSAYSNTGLGAFAEVKYTFSR